MRTVEGQWSAVQIRPFPIDRQTRLLVSQEFATGDLVIRLSVTGVAPPKRGERPFVANVDEAFADLAVSFLKSNIAHRAPCPVMANVCEAGSAVGGLFGQVATGLAHERGPLSL